MAPSLPLYFGGHLDSRITFSRASSGWYPEADGSLVEFGADEPRLGSLGLLVEGSRQSIFTGANASFAAALIKQGTSSATDEADIEDPNGGTGTVVKIEGADSFNNRVERFFGDIAASNDEAWTASVYIRAVSGTIDGGIYASDGTAGNLGVGAFTGVGETWTKVTASQPGSGGGSTNRLWQLYNMTGPAYIAWPDFGKGAVPTSTIIAGGAAATRAADVATIDLEEAGWFNPAEGTIYAEFMIPYPAPSGAFPSIISFLKDGANRITLTVSAVDSMVRMTTRVGDVGSGSAVSGPYTYGTWCRVAGAWKADDVAICLNGGAAARDTTAEIPTGLTDAVIGQLVVGNNPLNGYIRRLDYWPRRLSDEELVRKTS